MILNEKQTDKLQKYIEIFFIAFIVVQPLLDVVSYFGSELSLVFRVLAMGIGFIYLLFYPNKKVRWTTTIYIVVLGIFVVINTANNYMVKDPYFLVQELTYGVKSAYVLEMLLVYTAVFYSIRKRMDWQKIIQRTLLFNMLAIGLVMFLAQITGSGKLSYGTMSKAGHSGWFYSANDLSAILALGIGILVIYLIQTKNVKMKLVLLPCTLVVMWAALTVGTKVGLGAVIVVLISGIIISVIFAIMKKTQWLNVLLVAVALVLTVAYIPNSAVGKNLNFSLFETEQAEQPTPEEQLQQEEEERELDKLIEDNPQLFTNRVLSGRDGYLANARADLEEAPMSQKILGMGPGHNYEEELKIIEMDFYDWFYGYGPIGFILLILPLLYFGFTIIKNIIQHRFQQVNPTLLLLGIEVGLGLGIAHFAGHILLNPASGIYLALVLSYLYILSMNLRQQPNKI